jgi:NAD dependent epimerase/dehydratase family enzyme
LNAVAPNPLTNADFTRIAATVLHRPAIFAAPAFALRVALGEMAGALLLASQRVIPERLLAARYAFRLPDFESALRAILSR